MYFIIYKKNIYCILCIYKIGEVVLILEIYIILVFIFNFFLVYLLENE